MELYNEELVDLLNPRPKSAQGGPTIREDGNGKIVWVGLCDENVSSSTELLRQVFNARELLYSMNNFLN